MLKLFFIEGMSEAIVAELPIITFTVAVMGTVISYI